MQPKSAHIARVIKARADLLVDQPFFGFLALRLKVVEDPQCAGMWTDSVTLGINPAYIETLASVELKGLLSATVMKVVAGHPWRQDSRESTRWNEACAMAIHPLVVSSGFRLPQGMIETSLYPGKSAEFIYTKLPKPAPPPAPPEPPEGAPSGPGEQAQDQAPGGEGGKDGEGEGPNQPENGDGDKDGNGDGQGGQPPGPPPPPPMLSEVRQAPTDQPSLEAEWKVAMDSATHMQGDLAGNVMAVVNETLKSRVDWRSVLQNFCETSMVSPDYTMTVVNMRYLHLGFILPGLKGSSMKALVVARDTSGSVGNDYRKLFNGELLDIVERMKPEAVYVLDIDTKVRKVQELLEGDEEGFDPNTHGGGGTNFNPAFDYIEENDIDCAALVYLTDLLGRFPATAPDYPVLWAVPEGANGGKQPPFGELVELEVD